MAAGQPAIPMAWELHPIEMETHRNRMMSEEYQAYSPEVKQIFEEHMQATMMVMNAPMGPPMPGPGAPMGPGAPGAPPGGGMPPPETPEEFLGEGVQPQSSRSDGFQGEAEDMREE